MTVGNVQKCPTAVVLAQFVDGGLDARTREQIQAHLATCAACREVWYFADDQRSEARVKRWQIYLPIAAMLVLALALLGWLAQGRGRSASPADTLVAQLADAAEGFRFSQARVSGFDWAPIAVTRSATTDEAPLKVQSVALRLRELATTSPDTASLHGSGVALMALGRSSEALEPLSRAAAAADAPGSYRFDYGAALLETARRTDDAAMTAQALNEIEVALSRDPDDLAGLFNRGVALAQMGAAAAAVRAFEEYLEHDSTSPWATEARQRIEELRKQVSAVATGGAGPAIAEFDRQALEWANGVLAGMAARPPDGSAAQVVLAQTKDRRVAIWQTAFEGSSRWPLAQVQCLARAVVARSAFFRAYDEVQNTEALSRAIEYRAALSCAQLPVSEATAEMALARFGIKGPSVLSSSAPIVDEVERLQLHAIAGRLHLARGVAAGRLSRFDEGNAELRLALQSCELANDWELCSMADAMLAEQSNRVGAEQDAWAAVGSSLKRFPAVAQARWQMSILSTIANNATFVGWDGVALRFAEELRNTFDGSGNAIADVSTNFQQARAWEALGRPERVEANLAAFATSIARLPDALRQSFEVERDVMTGRLHVADQPSMASALLVRSAEFFRKSGNDTRRAETLLDLGRANRNQGQRAEAIRHWTEGVELVEQRVSKDRAGGPRLARTDRVWDLYSELVSAHLDQPALALRFAERARVAASLNAAVSVDDALDRSWIPEQTAILVLSTLPQGVGRWVLTRRNLEFSLSSAGGPDIGARIDRYLGELSRRTEFQPDRELSEAVFPRAVRASDVERVIVVADDALARLPFAPLLRADRQRGSEGLSISQMPSVSAVRRVALLPAASNAGTAVLAGSGRSIPSDGLDALPFVDGELRVIRTLYRDSGVEIVNTDTSAVEMNTAFRRASILHLAGHAMVDARFPERSKLFISPDIARALTPDSIRSMVLSNHPIVVLSACDTGRGHSSRGAGTESLASAFLDAGARAVIATLWPVGDADTSHLMSLLHRELRAHGPAQALSLAQQEARAVGMPARTWAAFMAISVS